MKKLFFISTSFFFGLNFISCEKEAEQLEPTKNESILVEQSAPLTTFKGVSISNEMLKFESLEDYYAIVNDPNPDTRTNFTAFVSGFDFDNYFTLGNEEPAAKGAQEMDDFFGQIINQNSCVQIGNHIYRTDLVNEAVFVVDASQYFENKADLINGNIDNLNISSYTLSDDVLSLVNGIEVAKCSNPGSFEQYTYTQQGTALETRCIIKYFTAGIYYRVTGRSKKMANNTGNYRYILECYNYDTEIMRNPCSNGEVTTHAVGVKMNTYNVAEPTWEMYSKSWQIKSPTFISIRTRCEFYGEDGTLYVSTPSNVYSI